VAPSVTLLALAAAALIGLALPAARAGANPMQPDPRQSPDARRQALLDAVRADAARRSGRSAEHLIVWSFEAVTWPDGALGCPEPDRVYTQALVPGYRIVVQAGDDELVYHASERGHWVWCPPGRAGAPIQRSI
jgi:hypothetical protein